LCNNKFQKRQALIIIELKVEKAIELLPILEVEEELMEVLLMFSKMQQIKAWVINKINCHKT